MLACRTAAFATALLLVVAPAAAAPITRSFTLTDGNAEVVVNPATGVVVWKTDGERDNAFLVGHFLRRPEDDIERRLREVFGTAPDGLIARDRARLSWRSETLGADLELVLQGGPAGSGHSRLLRSLTLANLGVAPLSLVVFDYIDLDGVFDQFNQRDRTRLAAPSVLETRNETRPELLLRTVVSPSPQAWQIADWRDLYFRFVIDRDGPTVLANTPAVGDWVPSAGAGDQAAVFSWAVTLAPGQRARFETVSERIIPKPASGAVLGLALAMLAAVQRVTAPLRPRRGSSHF